MATIPRYDEQQSSTNALPGQRQQISTPADAFGGQYAEDLGKVAKAVSGVADAALDAHQRAVDAADKTAVFNALDKGDGEVGVVESKLLGDIDKYTGPDAEIKDRFGDVYHRDVMAPYAAPRNTLSPRQQKLYDEQVEIRAHKALARGRDLENKANDNFVKATSERAINRLDNQVLTFGASDFTKPTVYSADGKNDKTNFDLAVDELRIAVTGIANVAGLTKPEEDALVDKAIGVWVSKSAERLIEAGDTLNAGMLLGGKYGDKVDSDTKKKITEFSDKKKVELNGLADAKSFLKAKVSLREALDQVDAKYPDPIEAQAIKTKVREQYGIDKQITAFGYDAARTELFEHQKTHPGSMPKSITDRMDPEVVVALKSAQSKAAQGVDVETDPKVFAALLNMTIARDPNLTDDVFWKHADKLKTEDVMFLVKKRSELLKPGEEGADEVTSAQQLSAQIKHLVLTGKSEGEFMRAYYRELAAANAATGKRSTYADREAILTRLALKTRDGKKAYQVEPADYGTTDWAISDEDLAKMKALAPNVDWEDKNVRNRQYAQYKLTGKIQ